MRRRINRNGGNRRAVEDVVLLRLIEPFGTHTVNELNALLGKGGKKSGPNDYDLGEESHENVGQTIGGGMNERRELVQKDLLGIKPRDFKRQRQQESIKRAGLHVRANKNPYTNRPDVELVSEEVDVGSGHEIRVEQNDLRHKVQTQRTRRRHLTQNHHRGNAVHLVLADATHGGGELLQRANTKQSHHRAMRFEEVPAEILAEAQRAAVYEDHGVILRVRGCVFVHLKAFL